MKDVDFHPLPDEVAAVCQQNIHPQARIGLDLFNAGEYFEAHEALEQAWREEVGPGRELYRGILQIAVAYYHILRGNYRGAVKMFVRARDWLAPFPEQCRGIDLAGLRRDASQVETVLLAAGPDGLARVERSLMKPIHYQLQRGSV